MSFYSAMIRPLLFRLDAERTHHLTVEACRVAGRIPGTVGVMRACFEVDEPMLHTDVAGLRFSNPIGLAAGWDKSGRALRIIDAMGFGFAEIGSVSARPSTGNPRPRLFRLPEERAIIVNYGLPNDGAECIAKRLEAHCPKHPLGVNLVRTNRGAEASADSADEILDDYAYSASLTHQHSSYLMLNLSCPNAEGGREFFDQSGTIKLLLDRLVPLEMNCPVFLKVAPNDSPARIQRLLEECEEFPFVRGFCFNLPAGKPDSLALTIARDRLANRPGAVAGAPVAGLINRCIARLYREMDQGRYVIIGTGGILDAEEAYLKLRLGASLVQLYTALIYEGPSVPKTICRELVRLLKRDGFESVAEAVGTGNVAHARD
ncbi:quinone-dependent dihydroorotate dehydrogenase [Rubinisphaera margarita]|uniref:quinone-dependent dihydroorotate dehydrogenase n=1 Tax=Rubinisphaera margarita TaxID=2909586 RepID=UPI001EE8E458|nr:quinone-dependent dihydroorotate dehydrogenase [Rubinisphaera margarita]MCG6158212.1 quinone-dependent dihydroorotate dehydrogenase [Rubinisphaera margarita]